MTNPNQIAAVVRIEKDTGAPLIVFGADGCYAHIGQHSSLSREYYRSCFSVIRSAVVNLVSELERAGSPSIPR